MLTCLSVLLAAAAAGAQVPAPELRFGQVEIVSRDIFARQEIEGARQPVRLMQRLMNGLHVNTRERVLRRELLFAPGDPYDPLLMEETARVLRTLGYLNDVRVVAVDTTETGEVDVLVSVRESWSLSTSFAYSLASGGDQRWNVKFAEKNFLGYGVTVGAGVGADEDRSYWRLWYRKRRMFGRALWFGLDWSETGDGYVRGFFLERPFIALDDAQGIKLRAHDIEAVIRWYVPGAAAGEPAGTSLHTRIPWREREAELSGLWRSAERGAARIWRLGGGVEVTEREWRPADVGYLSDGSVADLGGLAAPGGPMARETGVRVFPHLRVQTVGRRWTEARFVMQYGPVEDVPLDGSLDLRLGPAGGAVGSTTADGAVAWRADLIAEKWLALGRSYALLRVVGAGTAGAAETRTHWAEALAAWIGQAGPADRPWLTRVFVEGGHGSALTGMEALVLGLDRGLRTLDFDGMAGDRLVRWNVEQGKVLRREVFGLFCLGAAGFYDGGSAWWHGADRGEVRHEAGFGLRIGPTRSANSQIARIDLTWSLDGATGPVLTAITRGLF